MTSASAQQSPATDSAARTSSAAWIAVGTLTLATFLVVTSEMMPVGCTQPRTQREWLPRSGRADVV